jgi:5-formyltetrahydrofolate cyclo-ligase
MTATTLSTSQRKKQIREQGHAARRVQEDKDAISRQIVSRFLELPEYQAAGTVMFYIDVRDEVRTRFALPEVIQSEKRIVIPYCVAGELELFLLEDMTELEIGMYKILEPRTELRGISEKAVSRDELDLIMVPGVAFDNQGARTGHGNGYYDKLLAHARLDTPLVAIAFDCQIFPEVPVREHDVYMDKVITQSELYIGQGRRA